MAIRKMTQEERGTHAWIYKKFLEEKAVTYAKLFKELYLYIEDDWDAPASMDPRDGSITIDRSLDKNQILTIIRHEILHGFLKHSLRMQRKLAYDLGEDPDHITNKVMRKIKYLMYKYHYDFNYAADYEISNLSYTEKDKEIIRKVIYHGRTATCLVTEDQHPDWVGYTMEEMYDELQELRKKDEENHIEEDDMEYFAPTGFSKDEKNQLPPRPSSNSSKDNSKDQDNTDSPQDSEDGEGAEGEGDGDREISQNSSKGSNSSKSSKPKTVFGTFVDKNTFLDRNGNPISFE